MARKQKYNFKKVESKWQKYWQDKSVFSVDDKGEKKFYGLVEFPYPSGDGLHTGHLRSYTAMDVIARKKRMEGYQVLYPMGFDAFGLPAENYAIKTNTPPQITTAKNITNYKRQMNSIGLSFDWDRSFSTTDPEYYRWTQWIFVQMYKKGLAYKAKENINWCTSCKIGLANEEVVGGVCERCGGKVVKKEKEQWLLKITKYADRLIEDLDKIDFLPQIKKQQIDWIGRSEGAEIRFDIKDSQESLEVFTTRPDTLFGATFMVLAPEHELIHNLEKKIENLAVVKKYITATKKKSDLERADEAKEKTGVELKGIKAINPVNKEEIPIFVADYVMMTYGTGAIMAVPAHDPRDFEFAKKYNLKIKCVIDPVDFRLVDSDPSKDPQEFLKEIYTGQRCYYGPGKLINSKPWDSYVYPKDISKVNQWLEKNKLGKGTVNYKLHDWIFSRQRYWGEPIPMVFCKKCNDWLPVAEDELPVVLPGIKDFQPTEDGQSPLAKVADWVETTCPKCGGFAHRETDVMPNWAGSNWYFIRYCDSKNNKELIDPKKAEHWLPVDWYNGGMEHTTLHLLYSRFVFKFLYDIGVIPKKIGSEPYKKRTAQGMILGEGGIKMSKSKGNVINPDDYVAEYGADTVRVYEMFMGPFDQSIAWDDKGVVGVHRFLEKVWNLQSKVVAKVPDKQIENLLHKSIKKVGQDIESMRFNTAISQLMILVNSLDKQERIDKNIFSSLVLLLSPFAPHMAEEMWQILGNKDLSQAAWPKYNEALAKDDMIKIGIQVNGKLRDEIELEMDTEPSDQIKQKVLSQDKIQKYIKDKEVIKFIHIKNKIISVVVK